MERAGGIDMHCAELMMATVRSTSEERTALGETETQAAREMESSVECLMTMRTRSQVIHATNSRTSFLSDCTTRWGLGCSP